MKEKHIFTLLDIVSRQDRRAKVGSRGVGVDWKEGKMGREKGEGENWGELGGMG